MVGPGFSAASSRETIYTQSYFPAEQQAQIISMNFETVKKNFIVLGLFKESDMPVIDRESGLIGIEDRYFFVKARRAWEKAFDFHYIKTTFEWAVEHSNFQEENKKDRAGALQSKKYMEEISPYFVSAMQGVITIWHEYWAKRSYLNSSEEIARHLAEILLEFTPKLLPPTESLYKKVLDQIRQVKTIYAENSHSLTAEFERMINLYEEAEKLEQKKKAQNEAEQKRKELDKKKRGFSAAAKIHTIVQKAKGIPQSLRRRTKKSQKNEGISENSSEMTIAKQEASPAAKAPTEKVKRSAQAPLEKIGTDSQAGKAMHNRKEALKSLEKAKDPSVESDLDLSIGSQTSAQEAASNEVERRTSITLSKEELEGAIHNLKVVFTAGKTPIKINNLESIRLYEEKLRTDRLIRSTSESFLCFNTQMIDKIRVRNEAEKPLRISNPPVLDDGIDEWEEDLSMSTIVKAQHVDPLTQAKVFAPLPEGPYAKKNQLQRSQSVILKIENVPPLKKAMTGAITNKIMDKTLSEMRKFLQKRRNAVKEHA